MLLIISDASVLIDIECGKLTAEMFSLPWQFAVPDILFFEELEERHSHLIKCGLISKTMSGVQIAEAYRLRQKYLKTSVNDLLALTLAMQEKCNLLTSDKALREVAKELNVDVHGTIWLVEQMIKGKLITVEIARFSIQQMKDAGSRLPWTELDKILDKANAIYY